jgi:hypothetical protein
MPHTPGPWIVRGQYVFTAGAERTIAAVYADGDTAPIAAVPELLAAAIAIRDTCPCDDDITNEFNAAWNLLLAAIAKAEGR